MTYFGESKVTIVAALPTASLLKGKI